MAWKSRTFALELPVGAFPGIVERLRGTPARVAELVAGVSEEMLSAQVDGKWSAKENIGHLADLSDLDEQRLREFLAHASILSAADSENRATEAAGHNRAPIDLLLEQLRTRRFQWVRQLEALTEEEVALEAVHPRLQTKMRLVDWAYFVAEHDDHHLALARLAIAKAHAGRS
ncbi:MAG: DinB family protein [Acidobacteriaceae bacterium]